MAYIGLAKFVAASYDEKTNTYKNGFRFGKAVKIDIAPNYEDISEYNDINDFEDEQVFTHADIELGTDYTSIEAEKNVFGHTNNTDEITSCDTDLSKYIGLGLETKEIISGVPKYVAIWLHKVKLYEERETYDTKGENIEYKTPVAKGKAYPIDTGEWRKKKTFETKEQAKSWLEKMAGIS